MSEGLFIVAGKRMRGPEGLSVRTWRDPGGDVPPLRDQGPLDHPIAVVLHESVTPGLWRRAWRALMLQKYGCHIIVDREGTVTQHVDLCRRTVHLAGHNDRTLGLEVAGFYYPKFDPTAPAIDAVWAHRGRYVLPTPVQVEAVWRLVEWICQGPTWPPLAWPGLEPDGRFVWGPRKAAVGRPGVWAHHRTGVHADGLWPEHYCLCRSRGLGPERAYEATLEASASGQRRTMPPGG